ncbi:MAG: divalent cation transporter [Planctomycetaceae bacterium]|nr:MAG: divalent cation transporter [Planctomycetaceae bacterium]
MRFRLFPTLIALATITPVLSGCAGTRSATTAQAAPKHPVLSRLAEKPVAAPRSGDGPPSSSSPASGGDPSQGASEIRLAAVSEELESAPPESPVPDLPMPVPIDAIGVSAWTLASLEATAFQNNPAIAQASASAQKAMGFRDQVGAKPNPTIGYNGSQLADQGTDQHTAFVAQDIVMGGKLARNREVLNQEVQSQLWEVEAQRYRVQTDVRQRFYEALAAQRRLALATEFREIAAKGVEIAKARVEAKEGSVPEVLQAEIQLNQVEVQHRQAEAAFRGAWNQLMAVVGLSGTAPGVLEGTLPSTVQIGNMQPLKNLALSSSPELQAARARVARARANVERQEVQAIPNLSFMLAGGVDNGTNSGMINAQVGLPVPILNRNEGNIAAAHAELSRACQELRRIELSIESRMARAAQDYESAAAAVEKYQQMILPKAEETLKLSEEAYAAGEFGFLQVLVARRTYFESNLEYVIAQSNLAQAEAYLQGLALSGGLSDTRDTEFDAGLRDQSLSGQ